MSEAIERRSADVVVIGTGVAGLACALELAGLERRRAGLAGGVFGREPAAQRLTHLGDHPELLRHHGQDLQRRLAVGQQR